jgi:hypothetical protein
LKRKYGLASAGSKLGGGSGNAERFGVFIGRLKGFIVSVLGAIPRGKNEHFFWNEFLARAASLCETFISWQRFRISASYAAPVDGAAGKIPSAPSGKTFVD